LVGHGVGRIAIRAGDAGAADEAAVDYPSLATAVREAGRRLESCGLVEGDLVAALAPPSTEGIVLIHALVDRGIVLLPLNARHTEAEQAFALEHSGALWLLCSGQTETLRARSLADRVGCGLLRFVPEPGAASPAPRLEPLRSPAPALRDRTEPRRLELLRDRAALVLYTSGTSGRPKGAVLGFDALMANADASIELLGVRTDDLWLLCMPLFHVGGLSILLRSAIAGTAVRVHERFDVGRMVEALEGEGVTIVPMVSTMLSQLLEARGERASPPALRIVLLGGGPASAELLERARARGYPIAPTYGLTETASQAATRPPDIPPSDADLAGSLRPLPGVELRIVDAEGSPVEAGAVGEICVRGPIVMRGYLGDPEATARALRGGWLHTGDLGRLDREGGLRVLDRRSDLIVSGGENVYPAEVESHLMGHGDVVDAGVVGEADATFGQRPVAFVVGREGARLDSQSLSDFCREGLARYKHPARFVFVDSLPRTASGKLLRRELERGLTAGS